MKDRLKKELVELAKNIVANQDSLDYVKVHLKARQLYERAVVMSYIECFGEDKITPVKVSPEVKEKESQPIVKPMSSISEVPKVDTHIDYLASNTSIDAIFEDKRETEKRKSLNDNFTKSTKIGLNDRIAFIKHLFGGSELDFFSTLKKLEQAPSAEMALQFINHQVKPKYNHWQDKQGYEERFVGWVLNRYP